MLGPRRVLAKYLIQSCREKIRIRFRKYQRRAQLDDVVMRSVRSSQDSAFPQPIHDVIRFFWRGLTCSAVSHKVRAEK